MTFQLKNNYKMISGFVILAILILGIFYFVFSSEDVKVRLVDSEEFEVIISDENVFVLQAHVPYIGEIEGTDLIMTDWEHPNDYVDELPKDKETKIAVYCRSGRMSAFTSQKLIEMGYINVYDLDGGMKSWTESGKKLIVNQ